MSHKKKAIQAPRLTFGGGLAIAQYAVLPFLGVLLLLDVALYFFFKYVLDSCYGILCY